jgi:sRNA-binding carbon storage regulator CsrA
MALVIQRNNKQSIIIRDKRDSTQIRILINKLTSSRAEVHVEAPEKYEILREETINN